MNLEATEARPSTFVPREVHVPGSFVLGHLPAFRGDRVAFFHELAQKGDYARLRIGLFPITLISSPELAHELLVTNPDAFVKSAGLAIFARPLLGDGLLTSEAGAHKKQRRMMAPVFVQKHIKAYADVMGERAFASAKRMAAERSVALGQELARTTLEIVAKTLFDAEVGFEATEIGDALTFAMEQMNRNITSVIPVPPQIPTPGNRKAKRAIERLDKTVMRLVAERRASGEARTDVLTLLLAARDEDGSQMTDREIRDESMTIFLAGHETTANAVTWALALLSRNPEIRARLVEEVTREVPGDAPIDFETAKRLPYAMRVFKEAMRLYPPAYILGRRALRDISLSGVTLKKNRIVLVNIAGIHRRPELFPDPSRFDPDRFLPEREKALPRLAYMPFGAGPRVCIGNHFALLEGQILLATYARHVTLDLDPTEPMLADPLVTLRPRGDMRAKVTPLP